MTWVLFLAVHQYFCSLRPVIQTNLGLIVPSEVVSLSCRPIPMVWSDAGDVRAVPRPQLQCCEWHPEFSDWSTVIFWEFPLAFQKIVAFLCFSLLLIYIQGILYFSRAQLRPLMADGSMKEWLWFYCWYTGGCFFPLALLFFFNFPWTISVTRLQCFKLC